MRKVYVEAGCDIERELYLAILLDRADGEARDHRLHRGRHGDRGGRRAHAGEDPDRCTSTRTAGCTRSTCAGWRRRSASSGDAAAKLEAFLGGLYRLYVEKDASLVEINPLVVTKQGELLALDGKLNFDDNALYRHPDVRELRDPDEEDPRERAAKEIDLAYVGLDGDIGCMVNGAGLAMATLDMIQLCGGSPPTSSTREAARTRRRSRRPSS